MIKPYTPEREAGKIIIPEHVADGMQTVDARAVVVAVGPQAWCDEKEPRANPGDKVLVQKYTGYMARKDVTLDGETYRLVNDRDIFCGIEREAR